MYTEIVEQARYRIFIGYLERHHIIPRCLGGTNNKDNLVRLSYREHFICHRLLCKMHPGNNKLIYALSCMIVVSATNKSRTGVLTSRHFELVKRIIAPTRGQWNIGKTTWNKGCKGEEYKKRFKNGGLTPPTHEGTKWIHDGNTQRKLPANLEIPDGWVRGRLSLIGERNPMKNKDTATKNTNLRRGKKQNVSNKKSKKT